jgi:RiboL-PSP-HEPN
MLLSVRFKELQRRLRELKINMLPNKFSPTGEYTDRQLDRARGYRLLVHAEIESYLEDVAKDCVMCAVRKWKNSRLPSLTITSLLSSYHSGWNVDSDVSNEDIIRIAKTRVNFKDSVDTIIDLAVLQFTKKISDNHGIKENNFKTIIFPLGVMPEDLDSDCISNLNSFGGLRGELAHRTKKTTTQLNPEDEYKTVSNLILGLKTLDKKILNIKSL